MRWVVNKTKLVITKSEPDSIVIIPLKHRNCKDGSGSLCSVMYAHSIHSPNYILTT